MPATYEPIATTTLGTSTSTITFSSIPATFTDLRLVLVATASGGTKFLRFNSSTTGYSNTWILGDGSSATSGRSTSYPRLDLNSQDTGDSTPSLDTVDVFSYAGSTNKTCLMTSSHDENGSGQVMRQVGLWANTAAITQIDLLLSSSNTWSAGTTATLYGIKNA
jgi:hypothetical protein